MSTGWIVAIVLGVLLGVVVMAIVIVNYQRGSGNAAPETIEMAAASRPGAAASRRQGVDTKSDAEFEAYIQRILKEE